MTRPALWLNDPLAADLLRRTGWPALYDITDDWLLADRSPREHDRLVASERYLLDHCRQVVVCSPRLLETKSPGRAERVTLVPNAVDVDAYLADTPRPDDLPSGPVVLYVGTLHRDRLDVDLCAALASGLLGTATFVLVGPVALDAADQTLLTGAGAVLLGAREHTTIPAYLKNADVLVVPHVVTEFTDSLDPIKVYEYLAAARPVVSTPVAGLPRPRTRRPWASPSRPAFVACRCEHSLTREVAAPADARVATWDERAAGHGPGARRGPRRRRTSSSPRRPLRHLSDDMGTAGFPRRALRTTAAPAPASTPARSAPARVAPATRLRTQPVRRPASVDARAVQALAQGAEHVSSMARRRVATQVVAAEPEHPAQQHDVVALRVVRGSGGRNDDPWRTRPRCGRPPPRERTSRPSPARVNRRPMSLSSRALVPG